MNPSEILDRDQIDALDFAMELLGSASSCIGTHDKVAREMITEVVSVLGQISGRSALDVRLMSEPLSRSIH